MTEPADPVPPAMGTEGAGHPSSFPWPETPSEHPAGEQTSSGLSPAEHVPFDPAALEPAPWELAPSDLPASPSPPSEPRPFEPMAPEPDTSDPRGFTALGLVRDNLEAIAFALILALLLRHLVVEVFKIPTGSMEPTLFGDRSATRPGTDGDRILVQKDAYLLKDPPRWDIMVFHYPLYWPKAFIKRAVFLPDEVGRIERGDPWVGRPVIEGEPVFHPARKPTNVREQLYLPVYPPRGEPAAWKPDQFWREDGVGAAALEMAEHGRLVYRGDEARTASDRGTPARRVYGYAIRDIDRAGFATPGTTTSDAYLCPDVRLRCRVEASGPAEIELAWEPGDGRRHALVVASEGFPGSHASAGGRIVPLSARLRPGTALELALESVDGDLRVWVGGDEVAVVADEVTLEEAMRLEALVGGAPPQRLTVAVRGAPTTVDAIRVDRDIYYTNYHRDGGAYPFRGTHLRTGPDEYFMLGDNTRHSSDSRKWSAQRVRLADGREFLYDPRPDDDIGYQPRESVVDGRTQREIFDVEGVRRRWWRDEEVSTDSLRMPFVRRDRLIGRAWFGLVFWPPAEAIARFRAVR